MISHKTYSTSPLKPWYKKYCVTLIVASSAIYFGVIPALISFMNGIPHRDELETFHVKILETHSNNPHLLVETEDGSQETMEFPVDKSLSAMGLYEAKFAGWTNEERTRLRGCHVEITGAYLQGVFFNRFRVWELDCPSKNIRIDFATSRHYFRLERKTEWIFALVLNLVGLIFVYGTYLNDKRALGASHTPNRLIKLVRTAHPT